MVDDDPSREAPWDARRCGRLAIWRPSHPLRLLGKPYLSGGEWPIPCHIAVRPVAVTSVVLPAGYGVEATHSLPPRQKQPCPTGVVILGGVLASVPAG
jgi:hypothetical protein